MSADPDAATIAAREAIEAKCDCLNAADHADAALAAARPLIEAEATARERQRIIALGKKPNLRLMAAREFVNLLDGAW